uniref:Velvet domain-containing protein n=1 Tax=Mycena chlorophos TaxID=658473 RepID=A0ABQ0M2C3_MYCCL|nr:predicted protein [Mycena chlorophos]
MSHGYSNPYYYQPQVQQPPAGYLRAAIQEIQTPRVGRKCATNGPDRRPLDPPPVVQLKFFQTYGNTEFEVPNYDMINVDVSGFVCYAELFSYAEARNSNNPMSLGQENLLGTTIASPIKIHYGGKSMLVFAFPDVSSKLAGDFVLQYKFMNLNTPQPGFPVQTILGRCWGGFFKVHASREAPPLEAPTALTRAVADAGVRVNMREQTRGKRRRSDE